MTPVVLAANLGRHLRPYTAILPKPLVPDEDRPILGLILRQLATAGVSAVDLYVSHLGDLIQAYLPQSHAVPAGLEVRFHWEDEPLGTAGALRRSPTSRGRSSS